MYIYFASVKSFQEEEAYLVFADKCKATRWEIQRCFAFFALPYGWGEGSCFTSQTEPICAQAQGLLVGGTWHRWLEEQCFGAQDDCLCMAIPATVRPHLPWHKSDCIQGSAPKHQKAPTNALLHSTLRVSWIHSPESSTHWTFNIKAFKENWKKKYEDPCVLKKEAFIFLPGQKCVKGTNYILRKLEFQNEAIEKVFF